MARTALPSILLAAAVLPAAAWWRDGLPHERGPAPYPYPADRKYHPQNAANGIDESKINVHLVPHTHDDTGWQVTVDQYFFDQVYYVVDTVVDQLLKDPNRHFIYVEIAFFARWWDEQPDDRRNQTRGLVANGQLEFINGGWCMHDEAAPFYVEMVDQTTRGHQFLVKNFGADARPKGTWSIDPFGHSNTQAWLLGAESAMEFMFWGRTDYQDMRWRTNWQGQKANQWPEWIWQGSQSLGASAEIFAGQLGSGGYGTHIGWDGDGGAVQDNPERHDYNLDEMVDQFIRAAIGQQNITKTNHQMWPAGSDFQYQNADHWFHNLDKIIHYVNINATNGGPVRAFYSTPSHYTDAVKKVTADKKMSWEVRSDDIFPLADNDHEYWSGYFTSRPALKRQVRFASNFLNAARQMEIFSGVTAADVDQATVRPAPPVGTSWTDSFEGSIGVATHHDGMSGTERQSVADDYEQRISESHFEVETGVALSLKKLSGYSGDLGHCNCNAAGNCLNMSVCAFTTNEDAFTVVAWNPQGQSASPYLRLPVQGANWAVTDLATGATISVQTDPLDNRTLELPLLYVNHYGLNKTEDDAAKAAVANAATHVVIFAAPLPAVGYSTFSVKKTSSGNVERKQVADVPTKVSNGQYELTIDAATNSISKITNLKSQVSSSFDITWGYYESSEGGCSYMTNGTSLGCNGQASGAYMFRPINQTTVNFGKPTIEVTQGPLITEIKQTFAEWATHVVRLKNNSAHIEVEWTAGPIPMNNGSILPPLPAPGGCVGWMQTDNCDSHGPADPTNNKPCSAVLNPSGESGYCQCAHGVKVYGTGCGGPAGYKTCTDACNAPVPQSPPDVGKELVVKFSSGLASKGVFYTDSNGREMAKRMRDARGPSYPPLHINEPVAENYYPVNSMLSLDDGTNELAVITDVSMGGSSMVDGELEMMVHRRVMKDDSRGVQEPLNETMCGCNDIGAAPGSMGKNGKEGDGGCECSGLTMRGVAYVILDTVANAHAERRQLIEALNFPPTLAFAGGASAAAAFKTPTWTALNTELPSSIKMMTLTNNYADINNGLILMRLSHLYSVDEHPTLSAPVTVDLGKIFGKAGFTISDVSETTVTGNQPVAVRDAATHHWPTMDPTHGQMLKSANAYEHRFPYNVEDMTVTIRPMEVRTFLCKLA